MSFVTLHTGLSGLRAAQVGVDVTANNVANASTTGYTRQRVELSARQPYQSPVGPVGTGVEVDDVVRLRDTFLDTRVRLATADAAAQDTQATVLSRLETVLGEPDDGVTTQLNELWAALEDWTLDPTSTANRGLVLDRLSNVAGRFREVATGAEQLLTESRTARGELLAGAQQALQEIADINRQVANAAEDTVSNELLDHRDLLADEVASLLGATSTLQPDGSMTVQVAGTDLVAGPTAATLSVDGDDIEIDGTATPPGSFGGEVGGLQQVIRGDLPEVITALDDVAAQLADSLNAQNAAGFAADGTAGGPLLTYTAGAAASTLELASTDPATLAARGGATSGAYDATNAIAMADLRTSTTARTDGETHEAALRAVVVDVGARVAGAERGAAAASEIAITAEVHRTTAHGDSIDEEMVALVQYQRALEANSRVMTAADDMLDTVVNRLGRVGR